MKINSNPETMGTKIAKPYKAVKNAVSKSVEAVDKYTSPREGTKGDLGKGSYFQACINGTIDGIMIMGPTGIVVGAAPAAIGVAVANKTGKTSLGVIAGSASGAGIGAAVGTMVGGPAGTVTGLITGSVIGALGTFRGSSNADTRDSAGSANMLAAPFIPGPGKLSAGIGSAVGSRMESKTAKSIMGGITAAAIGGILAAIGFAPVSIPVAIVAAGAAGVLGPHFGPRYSQLFRNLANDIGNVVEKGAKKIGLMKDDKENSKANNVVGSIPSSFVKEGIKGFALSDGNIPKMLIAGVLESIKQANIFLTQKTGSSEKPQENETPSNNPKTLSTVDGEISQSNIGQTDSSEKPKEIEPPGNNPQTISTVDENTPKTENDLQQKE